MLLTRGELTLDYDDRSAYRLLCSHRVTGRLFKWNMLMNRSTRDVPWNSVRSHNAITVIDSTGTEGRVPTSRCSSHQLLPCPGHWFPAVVHNTLPGTGESLKLTLNSMDDADVRVLANRMNATESALTSTIASAAPTRSSDSALCFLLARVARAR